MEFLFVRGGGDFDFIEHSKNSKASCNVNTLQHNAQRLAGVNISLSRNLANKLSPLTSKLTSLLYVDWAEMSFWRGGRGWKTAYKLGVIGDEWCNFADIFGCLLAMILVHDQSKDFLFIDMFFLYKYITLSGSEPLTKKCFIISPKYKSMDRNDICTIYMFDQSLITCFLFTEIWSIQTKTGGFNPSEKYESQLGLLLPIYGKIKAMFQTTNQ